MNLAKQIADQAGVNESAVGPAARACANRRVQWHGGGAEAADGVRDDQSLDLVRAAFQDYQKASLRMAVSAHGRPRELAGIVYDILKERDAT